MQRHTIQKNLSFVIVQDSQDNFDRCNLVLAPSVDTTLFLFLFIMWNVEQKQHQSQTEAVFLEEDVKTSSAGPIVILENQGYTIKALKAKCLICGEFKKQTATSSG